ncbi:MAG TPA: decaprenyl-phosphate phosphoribosyltransferase [Anaerolineales bacterium]|jgi:4-hydroxybenzoate polyprenyltransferase|nr:decaprenyl-phosphate phosphoribosyltransferase [Anaerolineales bacterium]
MLIALIKAMRPRQWIKNVLIFAAVVFDRKIGFPPALLSTIAGVGLFSLIASAIYLINDISDLEADRNHPTKKNRPIASGMLPIPIARFTAILLLAVALPLAYLLAPEFALICLGYFILNISYSLWLKHIPLIDVLVLASFYVLRVAAGVTIIHVERFSPWLYIATTFLALFLGIGKRRAELLNGQKSNNTRRVLSSYTLTYLDQLIMIVLTITIVTYSLYTFFAPNLPENQVTMLTIPFVIYGVFRYLFLIQVEGRGEAPEEIILTDRPFQVNLILWTIAILLIFYFY